MVASRLPATCLIHEIGLYCNITDRWPAKECLVRWYLLSFPSVNLWCRQRNRGGIETALLHCSVLGSFLRHNADAHIQLQQPFVCFFQGMLPWKLRVTAYGGQNRWCCYSVWHHQDLECAASKSWKEHLSWVGLSGGGAERGSCFNLKMFIFSLRWTSLWQLVKHRILTFQDNKIWQKKTENHLLRVFCPYQLRIAGV